MKKTTLRQNVTNTDRQWFVVDAADKTLGRLSVPIANALRGKNRVDYTPHVDGGAYVIVLNADKINVTGNKETQKAYYRHSGFIGHLKTQFLAEVREKKPFRILRDSISGMLGKNRLRKNQLRRLILVSGDTHTHEAQKPTPLPL